MLGLGELDLHLRNTLLEVCFCLVHGRHPGVHLILAGMVERLELLEIGTHGLEELVFLGATAAGARFINNLEPDSSEDLIVKHLPFGWRSCAFRPWDADEQVVAHLQVLARARGSGGGRLVVNHPLPGRPLAGLPGRPLGGILSVGLGDLLGGDLVGLGLGVPGDLLDNGVDILPVR